MTKNAATANKDFTRIANTLEYLSENSDRQPSLAELAQRLHLSPAHFHRMFVRWAGITPKQFLQQVTLEKAKRLLAQREAIDNATHHLGLSTSSRLYDHFVQLDAVSPGEFKSGGKNLCLYWGGCTTPFGEAFIVWTERGIHRLLWPDAKNIEAAIALLRCDWPEATIKRDSKQANALITRIFDPPSNKSERLHAWVKGTNFQINVWRALLTLPCGTTCSYGEIAANIGKPKAVRAVGTAIGNNPIAYLIPCHRVIQASGALGGYRWGLPRKQLMLIREYAASNE